MKRLLLFLLALLFAGSTASAQDSNNVGLGVSLSSSSIISGIEGGIESILSPVSFYVPISLSGFRIEPEVGLFRTDESDDTGSYTQTVLQIGTGIFLTRQHEQTLYYFGGRVGALLSSSDYEFSGEGYSGASERSRTDLYVAPALGAEYLLSDRFSLGGEAQLMYYLVGNQEVDGDSEDADTDGSLLRTRPLLFVRWYF